MESNTPPPKRRWFQLHLSTCIVMMLAAGGLVFLNTRPRNHDIYWHKIELDNTWNEQPIIDFKQLDAQSRTELRRVRDFGWPKFFLVHFESAFYENGRLQITVDRWDDPAYWRYNELLNDTFIALILTLAIGFIAELLARRYARNRQS
jgi:hypothetical protein